MKRSNAESDLAMHIQLTDQVPPRTEYRFHPVRRWRFDFAWPDAMLAVEVDGVVYKGAGGRHQRAAGFDADTEKLNAATMLGWRVLRFTPRAIKQGVAINLIEKALREWHP